MTAFKTAVPIDAYFQASIEEQKKLVPIFPDTYEPFPVTVEKIGDRVAADVHAVSLRSSPLTNELSVDMLADCQM